MKEEEAASEVVSKDAEDNSDEGGEWVVLEMKVVPICIAFAYFISY